MNRFKHSLSTACNIGMWVGAVAFSALCLAPVTAVDADSPHHHTKVHTQDETNELGFRLQNDLFLAVESHDVEGYSDIISPIFQGLDGFVVSNRDEFITVLSNADIKAFGIQDLIAHRNLDVLTVSFNLILVNELDEVSNFVVVSVWQKLNTHRHHKSSCSHSHDGTWLLVSENRNNLFVE